MARTKNAMLSFRVSQEVKDALKRYAGKQERSEAFLAEKAVRKMLEDAGELEQKKAGQNDPA